MKSRWWLLISLANSIAFPWLLYPILFAGFCPLLERSGVQAALCAGQGPPTLQGGLEIGPCIFRSESHLAWDCRGGEKDAVRQNLSRHDLTADHCRCRLHNGRQCNHRRGLRALARKGRRSLRDCARHRAIFRLANPVTHCRKYKVEDELRRSWISTKRTHPRTATGSTAEFRPP